MGDKNMSMVMHNVSGPFTIGGKTFPHGVREVVIADDGTITVNGKPIEQCDMNEIEQSGLHITVSGDVKGNANTNGGSYIESHYYNK